MNHFLAAVLLMLAGAEARAVTITLDYSQANGYFIGNAVAKATLEKAALDLGAALSAATLSGVTPQFTGSSNGTSASVDWSIVTKNPSDLSTTFTQLAPAIPANTVVIFAGATTDLGGNAEALGVGFPATLGYELSTGVGTEANLVAAIENAINLSNIGMPRSSGPTSHVFNDQMNESVRIGDTTLTYTLDVGALAGILTFQTGAAWQFDYNSAVDGNEYDFYTVMLHEMMHTLGFGNSVTWKSKISGGVNWTGSHVVMLVGDGDNLINQFYNPGTPEQKADGDHIANGVMSKTVAGGVDQKPVMTIDLAKGERRLLTQLDLAFLLDIGYDGSPAPVAPAIVRTTLAPTPAPGPPDAPTITGPAKRTTRQAKIKIKGMLATAGAYVEFVAAGGRPTKAKGGAAWNFTVKPKPGKNVISVFAFDPASSKTSPVKKITVIRK